MLSVELSKISYWLLIADALLSAVAVGFALARRRGFASTLAWVAAIIAFPFLGALAYFLLANPYVRRTRHRRYLASSRVRQALATCAVRAEDLGELAAVERSILSLAARLTGMPASLGNQARLLTDNREAFALIEKSILEARRSIWAQYYIVHDDETGHRFLDLLTRRARDGLEVRLLYDAVGSADLDASLLEALRCAGGQVEEFLPVNPLRRRWAVHLRNHRKILIVDGEAGFTGGMNIGDEYSGSSWRWGRGKRPWRDAHLYVRGPCVRDLAEIFAEDWCFTTDHCPELPAPVVCPGGSSIVNALPSGPDQELNATGLVYFSGISSATSRCWITSPYFIPDDAILQALISAALRGVDVRVLVPRMNDVPLLAPAMRSYYPRLVRGGVRVFEYLPTMLHAKTMVVDGAWGLIGSANLDMRSFRLNFEASVLVHDPVFAGIMERRYESDLAHSREVTEGSLAERTLLEAIGEGAAQLLSPIL